MRAFFTARHLEHVPQRELAERLGLTHWAVRSLENRLRQELRSHLQRAGVHWGNADG